MVEPVLEVVAHHGEMRHRFVERISDEPPVCQVHAHLFQSSAERRDSVNMLDQHDLEQHHRVDAGSAVVLAVQVLYKFVDSLEVDGCVDLPQQVILRDHFFQTHKFKLSSIFCVLYQHVFHPTPLYHISSLNTRKRPPVGDLFRQAEPHGLPTRAAIFCRMITFLYRQMPYTATFLRSYPSHFAQYFSSHMLAVSVSTGADYLRQKSARSVKVGMPTTA